MSRRRQREPDKVRGVENRRHQHPDGSVTWTFRVRWVDPVTRRRLSETFTDQEAAVTFRDRRREARRRGQLREFDAGRDTFATFAREWWDTYVLVELEPGTRPAYRRILDRHVLPTLGPVELREINPQTFAKWRRAMTEQGVGEPTIRKAMVIAQSVLTRAVEWDRIPANPGLQVRKPPRAKRAVRPLPPLEVETIRSLLPTARDRTLVSVLAYSGLRPQEALALQWHHIGQRTIVVEQKNVDGVIVLGQKTKRPPRTVSLLAPLAEDLAAYRPAGALGTALVFPNEVGMPWTGDDYDDWRDRVYNPVVDRLHGRPTKLEMQAARARARRRPDDEKARRELERLEQMWRAQAGARPYDLRHSLASLLIYEGRVQLGDIAKQMGHSLKTLLEVYAHVIEEFRGTEPVSAVQAIEQAREQITSTGAPSAPTAENGEARNVA